MQTVRTAEELRAQLRVWRRAGERIAFVPTMGHLHPGHLQLVKQARQDADRIATSIFVNPMQFAPGEDYATYPRTLENDMEALQQEGNDLLFAPSVETIYPTGMETTTRVEVPGVGQDLEEKFRPGFFVGVATVVARLFNLVQPDVAVFGEKDYQQLIVIRAMVDDLCWPIEIISVPTVREADGLAMSSRNRYLTPAEREQAPNLYRVIAETVEQIRGGSSSYQQLEQQAVEELSRNGFRPDYVSIRHTNSLQPVADGERDVVVLAAAWLGKARLIDNMRL